MGQRSTIEDVRQSVRVAVVDHVFQTAFLKFIAACEQHDLSLTGIEFSETLPPVFKVEKFGSLFSVDLSIKTS